MLANTADAGGLEYNTADGTLWFVHAVGRHVAVTGDIDILAKLNGALDGIIDAHSHGTRFGIKVDPSDGLLQQGAPGWALTWMDARVDGQPITQRSGKAVEINALWINALGTITDLNNRLGRHTGRWQSLHDFARESFVKRFARGDHLLDVVGTTGPDDGAIRPNQLLALSLPHAPFSRSAVAADGALASVADAVVRRSRAELLTSLGMRSLSPHDPAYIGSHHGGPAERDRAYHEGTVWPWLIGPFVDAAGGGDDGGVLDGLVAHLGEWGLGSVSETADGDAPHGATGCPFQAWSVAELLRARRAGQRRSSAPPTIPASFSSLAGTTSQRGVSKGRNFSLFLLTPPPMMMRSGHISDSRWSRYSSTRLAHSFQSSFLRSRALSAARRSASLPRISMMAELGVGDQDSIVEDGGADAGAEGDDDDDCPAGRRPRRAASPRHPRSRRRSSR